MERSTIFNGKTHYKWQFSIAMLNYQRVRPDPEFGGAMFAMFLDKPGLSGLSSWSPAPRSQRASLVVDPKLCLMPWIWSPVLFPMRCAWREMDMLTRSPGDQEAKLKPAIDFFVFAQKWCKAMQSHAKSSWDGTPHSLWMFRLSIHRFFVASEITPPLQNSLWP